MSYAEERQDAAIGWVIRLRDPEFAQWDSFVEWLEADVAHAAAYDTVAIADVGAAAMLRPAARPVAAPAFAVPALRTTRRVWLGWSAGAIAAALIAAVAVPQLVPAQPDTVVATAAGEKRSIVLADGTRVDLNGGTRLAYAAASPREVRLDVGEALFSVRHSAVPFTVTAGDATLRDVGTVFNVTRSAGRTEVAVAEGGVLFNPEGEKLLVSAGGKLVVGDAIEVGTVDAASVGAWRSGRLVYHGATVGQIAADLSRNIGETVVATPAARQAVFTGTIVIDSDRTRLFARVSGLLGVEATHGAGGWRLAPRTPTLD